MKTPLRKLRVDDDTWNAWKAAAPDGNVSGWLRELANAALTTNDLPSGDRGRPSDGEVPAVTIGEPSRRVVSRPRTEEFIRREAELLSSVKQEV